MVHRFKVLASTELAVFLDSRSCSQLLVRLPFLSPVGRRLISAYQLAVCAPPLTVSLTGHLV